MFFRMRSHLGFPTATVLIAVAVLYSSSAQALGRRAKDTPIPPPAPGKLVEIGGFRMHVHAQGSGDGPTVILETGLTGMSAAWGWVAPVLAESGRVITYDRAGLGWSDAGNRPHDALNTAHRLRRLLEVSGEEGPYILVGHSLGGLFVRMFADLYPDEVVGLVLVDASHPDQSADDSELRDTTARNLKAMRFGPAMARLGVLQRSKMLDQTLDGLPPTEKHAASAFLSSVKHMRATRAEAEAWPATVAQVRGAKPLGDMPLVVLTAGVGNHAAWKTLQADLATLSTIAEHRVVEGASHFTIVTEKRHAQAIVDAVKHVREQVPTPATEG
jgi:pimeloyl-ACP methyl ester carboxylesterase